MAITSARTTSDFSGFLNPEMSAPIFDDAARQSVAQRLARRIPLGSNGQAIPVTSGKPVANWVSEGGQKPATQGSKSLMTMEPKKLAAIIVNSAEVVRADPGGYITGMRGQLAEAFAIAFDLAALHDLGGDGSGSGPFDDALADTTKSVEFGSGATVHNDIVAGLELLVEDGKRLTGFAFDDVVEPRFLDATDANDRPIYIDTPLDETTAAVRPGRLIGRTSLMTDGIANDDDLGFAGDWSQIAWGVVGGISYDVSDEATVTIDGSLTSLWEHNLVAIRAEAEYGLVINDVDAFVRYTQAAA